MKPILTETLNAASKFFFADAILIYKQNLGYVAFVYQSYNFGLWKYRLTKSKGVPTK